MFRDVLRKASVRSKAVAKKVFGRKTITSPKVSSRNTY